MSKKLYVGNLVYEVTDEDLKVHFGTVGIVVSAVVIKFRDTGKSKGFGFVEMTTEEEAKSAIDTLNGKDFEKTFNPSSVPYRFSISNEGGDRTKLLVINMEEN
ncbi:MAG: hypothetical protein AAB437_02870 [Patescibacteria group bacterium]